MLKKFRDLTEKEILALAISSEEEDGRIYGEFAEFGCPILLPSATTNRYSCARSQRANALLIASASSLTL